MNNAKYLLPLLIFFPFFQVSAQEDVLLTESDNTFVQKLRESEPRPKFFELNYSFVRDVSISSKSDIFDRNQNEIEFNPRFELKLKAPIILKENLSIIGGFVWKQEFFDFENTSPEAERYYENLDRRNLQNIGLRLYVKKNLSDDKFIFAYWNGNLNSDDVSLSDFIDQLRTNVSVIFVKKVNELTQIGYGGAFGYTFGGANIFPVFMYTQTFSKNFNIEMLLPKSIKLRYTSSAMMHYYMISEINGASYFLREPTVEGFEKVTFQRSAVNLKFRLEREIYDWLWFGLEAGYNIPINLFISEPRKNRKDAIITFSASATPIFGFSLFAVVPKKIHYKKAKKG